MDAKWKSLVKDTFQDHLVTSFINGRAALYLADSEMDVDIFVVLKNDILSKRNEFNELWKKFVIGYKEIHLEYGFKPDNYFPGDFVTEKQVEEMLQGRGFTEKNGIIYIQPMGSIDSEVMKMIIVFLGVCLLLEDS